MQERLEQLQRQRAIDERRDKIESEREAARDIEAKQVLADNPNLQKYCDERKAKIQETRDKYLDLAERFYILDEEQVRQLHKPKS